MTELDKARDALLAQMARHILLANGSVRPGESNLWQAALAFERARAAQDGEGRDRG